MRDQRLRDEYAASIQDRELPSSTDESPSALGPEEVAWALTRCSVQERLLFQVLYVDGAPTEEAGALLGVTREALYLRKHRFHQKIETLIEERFRGQPASPSR